MQLKNYIPERPPTRRDVMCEKSLNCCLIKRVSMHDTTNRCSNRKKEIRAHKYRSVLNKYYYETGSIR